MNIEKKIHRIFPIQFDLSACHIVTDVAPRDQEKEKSLDAFFSRMEIPLERHSENRR